jgi:hypothetical protein
MNSTIPAIVGLIAAYLLMGSREKKEDSDSATISSFNPKVVSIEQPTSTPTTSTIGQVGGMSIYHMV